VHVVQKPNIAAEETENIETETDSRIVLSLKQENSNHITKELLMCNSKISFILDTGSPINILDHDSFKQLKPRPSITDEVLKLKGISGATVSTNGYVDLPVETEGGIMQLRFHIVNHGTNLLGLEGLRKLDLNLSKFLYVDLNFLSKMIDQASRNTGQLKLPPVELTCLAEPKFLKSRPLAYGLRDAVKENLQSLEQQGILEKVQSSSWTTPIVVVRKQNGTVRICGDYRVTVNAHIQQVACISTWFHNVLKN